jgi:hypothetical protein
VQFVRMGIVFKYLRRFVSHRALLVASVLVFSSTKTFAAEVSDVEGPRADQGADTDAYDPWAGMDRDGRIPSVTIPLDVPNPSRWRYYPEGRSKPGSMIDRLFVTSFIAPYVFQSSDVGTGGGIAITDIDFRNQRRREFLGVFSSYTSEGQQNFTAVWERRMHQRELPAGGVLVEDRSHWRLRASYSKTLTRRFFGLGPNTKERDEASYTDELLWLELGFERAVPEPGSDWIVGLSLRGELHDLSKGKVGGALDVADLDARLYRDAQHHDLGRLVAIVRHDTRDSPVNPYRGWVLGADVDAAPLQTGGDSGALFRLYGSTVHPVPAPFHDGGDEDEENPPTDTIAFGFRSELTTGSLPFFSLPTLGGRRDMRGFIDGRFRGDASWLMSAEYRFWFVPRGFRVPFTDAIRIERVGAAFFYDTGAVAGEAADLFDVKVRHSYGVGLRFMLERTAPFRVDLGFSEDGYELSAGFGFTF